MPAGSRSRSLLARAVVLGGLALLGVLVASASADTPQPLRGTVGPGFEISLVDASGADVKAVDTPGTYTFVVDDLSELHDFHLVGPGVDERTAVEGMGQVTWTLQLAEGVYTFFCDPHATTMRGSFTVGTPPTTAPPPAPQRLAARVGPGRRLAFVSRARAGRTLITVRDLSATDNFHLVGPGVNRRTGITFRGTATWTVTLRKGTYTFGSDARPKVRGRTTVA